jgi:hypothetical protein
MNQIIKLWQSSVATAQYQQLFTSLESSSELVVGNPVRIAGVGQIALATADTLSNSQLFGFVAAVIETGSQPEYIVQHYCAVSSLSGLTPKAPVYLTNVGGYSATPGTIPAIVGTAISTTAALLTADAMWAQITPIILGVLPSQSGQSGNVLGTNGTSLGWVGAPVPLSNTLTNAMLAQAAQYTVKGNNTGSTANEADLTVSQLLTMLTPIPITAGGSGQITANLALNAYLPSQTGNSGKVLGTNGTNTAWGSLPTANNLLPSQAGQATNVLGTDGTNTLWIPPGVPGSNSITNSLLAQAAQYTLKGNNTGSTANEADLTIAQVQALLGYDIPIRVVKGADCVRTAGSPAISDDTSSSGSALIIPLAAGHTYKVKAFLKFSYAGTSGNVISARWNYTGTGGTLDFNMCRGNTLGDYPSQASFPTSTDTFWCDSTGTQASDLYVVDGFIATTAGTGGNLSLQWTCTTGSSLNLKKFSILEAVLVA